MNGIACTLATLAASYVGGELPGSAEQAYEEHFMDCEDCLCAVEVWRAMVQGLRERDQAMQSARARPGGLTAATEPGR
jgi:hypothetical protein